MKRVLFQFFVAGLVCVFVMAFSSASMAAGKIDINTATVEQLTELPGIGPAIAGKIVEHRKTQPFASTEEIMDVSGIGQGKYDAIKDLITVEKTKTKKE